MLVSYGSTKVCLKMVDERKKQLHIILQKTFNFKVRVDHDPCKMQDAPAG